MPRAAHGRRLLATGLLALSAACSPAADPPALPNVVLVSLDTTRADRLGVYGNGDATSPALDRLARDAVTFTRAYSTSSWTLPAHASLFTGKLPSSHGARKDPAGPISLAAALPEEGRWDHYRARGLAEAESTLAELLAARGYQTAAVVAGPWMKAVFGLAQGFESYDESGIGALNGRPAEEVTRAALRWLVERDAQRPFLLFAHYYDPHFPYQPPARFKPRLPAERLGRGELLSRLYDAEIRYMDSQLGDLLDGLRAKDLYAGSWIIVTSDHGEVLGEHGRFGHGKTLTQMEIRVPLLVKYPAGHAAGAAAGGQVDRPVLLTDVLPTLLADLGLPVPEGIQGEPLDRVAHPIVAEVYPLPAMSDEGDWRVILEGDWKYIWNSKGRSWLADLAHDPSESLDASPDHPEVASRLRREMLDYLAALPAPLPAGPARRVDEETQRALEGLGYLE